MSLDLSHCLTLEIANGWVLTGGPDVLLNQTLAALLSISPSFSSQELWTFLDKFDWGMLVSKVLSNAQKRLLHVPPPLKQNDYNFASEPCQKAAASWALIIHGTLVWQLQLQITLGENFSGNWERRQDWYRKGVEERRNCSRQRAQMGRKLALLGCGTHRTI